MLDCAGREVNYLRVAVTDRCNLRCVYCMPEDGVKLMPAEEILSFEEIFRVVKCVSGLEVNKVRITGGEPLVRKDLAKLIRKLKKLPFIEEVSLSTNGTFLEQHIKELELAGLDRVNISLDTLKKEKYKEVTKTGRLEDVLRGIDSAVKSKLAPVKINVVASKDINYSEIMDFVKFSEETACHVRFIEMMPIGEACGNGRLSNQEVKEVVLEERNLIPANEIKGNGPAVYYQTKPGRGVIGFISPISHGFCSSCNRIRLTPEGYLKLCLQREEGIYLKDFLRGKVEDEILKKIIKDAVKNKPSRSLFEEKAKSDGRIMSQIGG